MDVSLHTQKKGGNAFVDTGAFEQLSGLRINFHKSEIFCYGAAKEMELYYTKSKIHWRPFNLSPCTTLVHELANAKKRPLNLSACATLVHELAKRKSAP